MLLTAVVLFVFVFVFVFVCVCVFCQDFPGRARAVASGRGRVRGAVADEIRPSQGEGNPHLDALTSYK